MSIAHILRSKLAELKFRSNHFAGSNSISRNNTIGKYNSFSKVTFNGCKIGNNCNIRKAILNHVRLADKCTINDSNIFSSHFEKNVFIGWNSFLSNCKIDKYTYIAGTSFLYNTSIGKFCSIANGATIGHAEHPLNHMSSSSVFYKPSNETNQDKFATEGYKEFLSTQIGNDVWIGTNVFIKAGITIADGAVIGAGAVVTKNVAPYSVVAGVPATHIKYRFPKDIVQLLVDLQWWNWQEDFIQLKKHLFAGPLYPEIITELMEIEKKFKHSIDGKLED